MDAREYVIEHQGVRVGDSVEVANWRYPGSLDRRSILAMWRARCQGGVMIRLDKALQNGSTEVSLCWVRGVVR